MTNDTNYFLLEIDNSSVRWVLLLRLLYPDRHQVHRPWLPKLLPLRLCVFPLTSDRFLRSTVLAAVCVDSVKVPTRLELVRSFL